MPERDIRLFHKFFDGFTQVIDGVFISGLDGVDHTVADVVAEDHLAGVVDGAADRRQLDEHIGAVVPLLHHPLDLVQVTDGPGQTVDDCLLVLVDMAVGVGDAVLVHPCVVVFMLSHGTGPLSPWDYIIFCRTAQPTPGDNRKK